jgi:tripartite-type tricarboxylate transporter receptor subunit TctC
MRGASSDGAFHNYYQGDNMIQPSRRRQILGAVAQAALVSLGCSPFAAQAQAQDYPNRPITVVVPFPPGGATDTMARIFSQKLSEAWNVPVVVDYKPGAGSTIGLAYVSKAKPDGYTLVFATNSATTSPALYKKVPFDTVKDFTWISQVCSFPLVLTVHPGLNVKNVADLLALAKKDPGKLNFSSSGNGTGTHLASEYFKARGNIDVMHVPYKGSSASTTAVMTGESSFTIDTFIMQMPLIKAGKVQALATTSPARMEAMPNLPTVAETIPNFNSDGWLGFAGPPGMPPQIVNKIADEVGRIAKLPDVKERLAAQGVIPVGGTAAQFLKVVTEDLAKWQKVVDDAKIPKID